MFTQFRRKTEDPAVSRLRACPLFGELTTGELSEIVAMSDEAHVPAGRRLIRQGELGHEAFVILDGSCRVLVDDVEVATLGPGDIVGEMGLLEVGTRSATVVTDTQTHLLAMEPRSFTAFVESHGRQHVMQQLARRLRRANEQRAKTDLVVSDSVGSVTSDAPIG
jgi:CRP-like cAMP-binding protein